jgi:hypothetical protein
MLKHLNIEEMGALLEPWVNKNKRRGVFLSIPEIAPLHGKVVKAYEAALAVRPPPMTTPSRLVDVVVEINATDDRHDHLARAVALALDTHAEMCLAEEPPDNERAANCRVIESKLFPSGLTIVNAALLAESTNAARVGHLIEKEEPALAMFLETIQVTREQTLLDVVQRWIATGAKLGELEREREALVAEQQRPHSSATVTAVRGQWLKLVSQILSLLELSEAPAEDIEKIRGPVLRAAERAGKRYAGYKEDEPVVEDVPDEGEG